MKALLHFKAKIIDLIHLDSLVHNKLVLTIKKNISSLIKIYI